MSKPHLSEYGIGTTADPNARKRAKNCMNCGRFLPKVPAGWEICQFPESDNAGYQDYEKYEYDILVHDCNTGTALEMLIKREKRQVNKPVEPKVLVESEKDGA